MTSLTSARAEMRDLRRAPEPAVLARLLPAATLAPATRAAVENRALGLLADLRAAQGSGWVNRFLQQYRLNTAEGVALLSLAEAFLRVPDAATADLLIRDKIGGADWGAHTGKSDSLLVNSATWGLVLTRAVVGAGERASVLQRLIARSGEPFVRTAVGAAMRMMGQIFVMGRTIDEALDRASDSDNKGFTASFDMLGEAARTRDDAVRYYDSYVAAIQRIGASNQAAGHSISVKLSALHPRYETAHVATCVPELTDMLGSLASAAAAAGIGLTVDAEETERLDMSLDIIAAVAQHPQLRGWDGLGMAAQAYGKRAAAVIDWAQALGAETSRQLGVRLVKGAYWDSEIKRTQVEGLADYPLFTRKAATDVSYLACAAKMLAAPNIFPAFATHNALTVATILEWAGGPEGFEFQRLHGMGEGLYERLVREDGYACRSYAPVGGHRDLLAYLVRRLLENGANSSFVHQLADAGVSDIDLLADPAVRIAAVGGTLHPSIPLPRDLFPGRTNSSGLDLADAEVLARVERDVLRFDEADPLFGKRSNIKAADLSTGQVASAVAAAHAAFPAWDATPVGKRADILERLGALLERDRAKLMALCVDEAKKTIGDALGEVREAVDFCRYYAAQAREHFVPVILPGPTGERNELRLAGRGVFACIAPWNFPLAIFLGQVTAALAAGNTVVAKPAPQTPRIAAAAVALAHEAGVPAEVLRLVIGGGDVGSALVGDPRIMGVAFTGSTRTARAIARTLLDDDRRPLVPLIAETGGLNAMIVDSTALPEQVVVDVVTSAFRSAGQRCSALRLLLLQEDIAERTLDMLKGAMDTLIVGAPGDPRTDVGPVIDEAAFDRLETYRQSKQDRWVHTIAAPAEGNFIAPTIIRLPGVEALREEWFGPILHVATWRSGELDATVAAVNASGYGLTMGLHSRIASSAERVAATARVGNLYVNRAMIGAVVGSQPFGGEGLSGTGPKAGGPHYLPRFAVERVVSTDTTSAGGNASLLSIEDAAGI
ncbi:bifunctional proline dehydrogenase/L-glutamate gamma-semialdehyde dehydrogenase PutA [Polymorphobacter sp. PAMC 29334]|uniref:bifunctional proline dehydrogenase/L-glutamate gamma-semialdehyde dehydrogenase PutA n=1 Tax=Polymorphobacter sp. PAMC 29334 TaxID=2862331 RepID=UPI001C794982|nr:bifunctional proline dehydrogenase/L-glutamate gamma-semialdehyde dehydrogenase PutA [Polymorphobacter sp. PAMC 29334]QYE35222.1 bifunctional proline dehydrogenase/L-glutamate gamma-semialdehyde dehydrogenase PutA [Polymorphobacter sp. PAMC 29334]